MMLAGEDSVIDELDNGTARIGPTVVWLKLGKLPPLCKNFYIISKVFLKRSISIYTPSNHCK
jgi:hypothetical protein